MKRAGPEGRLVARLSKALAGWRKAASPGARGPEPAGVAPLEPEAERLLALGRERALLDRICRPGVVVDVAATGQRLLAARSLAAAAAFVQRCPPGLAGVSGLRVTLQEAAGRALKSVPGSAASVDAVVAWSDAALALHRLQPDSVERARAVDEAARRLLALAARPPRRGRSASAATALTWAARLRPGDRAVLVRLAEAAGQADDAWLRDDTLARLANLDADFETLAGMVEGALANEQWEALCVLLDRIDRNSTGGAAIQRLLKRRRPDLRARLSRAAAEGDWPAGLGLAGALAGWIAVSEWPAEEVAALLAPAHRRLRDPRSLADPAVWPAPDFILRMAPDDLDAARLAGRNRLRQRRLREAVQLYAAVVAIDPHAARDWIDLASAHDRLGEGPERDACLARATAIDPASLPAPLSEAFWARMAAA